MRRLLLGIILVVRLASIAHAEMSVAGVASVVDGDTIEIHGQRLPSQEWALREILVSRREEIEWRRAHRHADPLARGIRLQQAAALARGDPI